MWSLLLSILCNTRAATLQSLGVYNNSSFLLDSSQPTKEILYFFGTLVILHRDDNPSSLEHAGIQILWRTLTISSLTERSSQHLNLWRRWLGFTDFLTKVSTIAHALSLRTPIIISFNDYSTVNSHRLPQPPLYKQPCFNSYINAIVYSKLLI